MQIPGKIKLKKNANTLLLCYGDDSYELPAEYLRVHSPSAEVQGHGTPVLQYGKIDVKLLQVIPVGQYALKLVFDDGHDSGLFSWEYLHQLALHQERYWQDYLDKLNSAGKSRDPHTSAVRLIP